MKQQSIVVSTLIVLSTLSSYPVKCSVLNPVPSSDVERKDILLKPSVTASSEKLIDLHRSESKARRALNYGNGDYYRETGDKQISEDYRVKKESDLGGKSYRLKGSSMDKGKGGLSAHDNSKHHLDEAAAVASLNQKEHSDHDKFVKHSWNRGDGFVKRWSWDKGDHLEKEKAEGDKKHLEHHEKGAHREHHETDKAAKKAADNHSASHKNSHDGQSEQKRSEKDSKRSFADEFLNKENRKRKESAFRNPSAQRPVKSDYEDNPQKEYPDYIDYADIGYPNYPRENEDHFEPSSGSDEQQRPGRGREQRRHRNRYPTSPPPPPPGDGPPPPPPPPEDGPAPSSPDSESDYYAGRNTEPVDDYSDDEMSHNYPDNKPNEGSDESIQQPYDRKTHDYSEYEKIPSRSRGSSPLDPPRDNGYISSKPKYENRPKKSGQRLYSSDHIKSHQVSSDDEPWQRSKPVNEPRRPTQPTLPSKSQLYNEYHDEYDNDLHPNLNPPKTPKYTDSPNPYEEIYLKNHKGSLKQQKQRQRQRGDQQEGRRWNQQQYRPQHDTSYHEESRNHLAIHERTDDNGQTEVRYLSPEQFKAILNAEFSRTGHLGMGHIFGYASEVPPFLRFLGEN